MRITTPAGLPLALAAAAVAAAALGYLGPAAALAAADPSSATARGWCTLSPLTGGPGQATPPPEGTAEHDSRYTSGDPRPPVRQPTAPCQPATAA
jgi:hypothetical protein